MSFKCSIFGHKYGASEVEREREEDGSEVVTTVRETETCLRCGETRVVSENKEVTTMETAADIVGEDLDAGAETPEETTVAAESTEDGAVPEEATEDYPEESTGTAHDGSADVQEDRPDETPIPDAEGATEPEDQELDDDAPSAEEDDAVILGEDDEDDERGPGEWPEEPREDDDEWEPETSPVHDEGPDIEQTGTAVTVPDGSFFCPECEYTTPVEESSLRAGDFCPECHKGALEHHTD